MNRSFFPYDSVEKNIYKIYAIDIMCGERLKKNLHDLQLENENKRKRQVKQTMCTLMNMHAQKHRTRRAAILLLRTLKKTIDFLA